MKLKKYNGERSIYPAANLVEKTKIELKKYYIKLKVDKDQINNKITSVIDKACWGWPNCPDNFEARIAKLKGHNSNIIRKSRQSKSEKDKAKKIIKQKKAQKEKEREQNIDMTFINHLNLSMQDKKFLKIRKMSYYNDFEFNSSSDEMILNKIILDELRLKNLEEKSFNHDEIDLKHEQKIDIISKRLKVNIDSLGISRKARIETDQNIEGNIAQLAFKLEKKLDEIKELDDEEFRNAIMSELLAEIDGVTKEELKQYIDEITFQKKHEAFPEQNSIPESILFEDEAKQSLSDLN